MAQAQRPILYSVLPAITINYEYGGVRPVSMGIVAQHTPLLERYNHVN